MKLSIRGKLFVGFSLLLLLMMTVGTVSWQNAHRLLADLNAIYEANVRGAVYHLATTQNALWQLHYGLPQFLVLQGEARQKIIDDEPAWYKTIAEAMAAYATAIGTDEEKTALKEWQEIFAQYKEARTKWFELQIARKPAEAAAWRAQMTTPLGTETVQALARLIDLQHKNAETKQREATAVARTQEYFLGALLAGAIVLGLSLSGWIARSVTRSLRSIVHGLDDIRAGDLTAAIPVGSNDELGQIATVVNAMVHTLHDSMTEVTHASMAVAQAAHHLSSTAEEVSIGAQQQASSLEETAVSLEELSGTIQQNADNAQQANHLAIGSWNVAETGGQIVSAAVSAMHEINQSSRKIADIITVIDEIAFQTNLLALNAAVEAARAGEQGRGFAVVAAEVRNLAQRSAAAAKEIKSLIQDSTQRVQHGAELVTRSGQTLEEIVISVKRVTDIVSDIAAASREQANGIAQVSRAVTQMDQVVQSNPAQTEEMNATARTLTAQAEQLQLLVRRFKLHQRGQQAGNWQSPAQPVGKVEIRTPQAAPKIYVNGQANGHTSDHTRHVDGLKEF